MPSESGGRFSSGHKKNERPGREPSAERASLSRQTSSQQSHDGPPERQIPASSPGAASGRSVQFSDTVIAITPDGERRQEALLQRASRELLYFSPPPHFPSPGGSAPPVPFGFPSDAGTQLSPECEDIEQSCL